jgi:hypothetical protein
LLDIGLGSKCSENIDFEGLTLELVVVYIKFAGSEGF